MDFLPSLPACFWGRRVDNKADSAGIGKRIVVWRCAEVFGLSWRGGKCCDGGVQGRYSSQQWSAGGRESGLVGAPVTRWTVLILAVVGLLNAFLHGLLLIHLGMFPEPVLAGQVWRLVTYVLVPSHLVELVADGLMLFWFGALAELVLGSRRVLAMFVWVIVVGGLLAFVVGGTLPRGGGIAGARGLVLASLMVLYLKMPQQRVSFFAEMKLGVLCLLLMGIAVLRGLIGQDAAAMSVGSLSAVVLVWALFERPQLLEIFQKKKTGERAAKAKRQPQKLGRARTKLDLSESEVDRILDKVNEQGLGGLTDYEREVLKFAANDDR